VAKAGVLDGEIFEAVVDRVRNGQDYYTAQRDVFSSTKYPVNSVFNYRLPTYAWTCAALPNTASVNLVLGLLGAAILLFVYRSFRSRSSFLWSTVCTALLAGGVSWVCLGQLGLYTEAWAGLFILVSVLGYRAGYDWIGLSFGLLAVYFRELAVPYVLICLGLAGWNRQGKQVVVWLVGLSLYVLFLGYHAMRVWPLLPTGQFAAKEWVDLGGPDFFLSTAQMNIFLLPMPKIVVSGYFLLCATGAAVAFYDEKRLLLTLLCYFAIFMLIGGTYRAYWGMIYAPLLPLSLHSLTSIFSPVRQNAQEQNKEPLEGAP
jgi:hypothetical protein